MKQYQKDFVSFLIGNGALKFGDFTLKSGRQSPFFMNLGDLNSGDQLDELAYYYADAIVEEYGEDFDVVFGPAYKGIPLAAAIVVALFNNYDIKARYCSNRKEIKDHGDKGILLGAKLKDGDRIIIVEDVTTSGKSMDETVPILRAQANVEIVGSMVSLDRQEVGQGDKVTALEEISEKYGFPTAAIVTMDDVKEYLSETGQIDDEMKDKIEKYYKLYGVKEED